MRKYSLKIHYIVHIKTVSIYQHEEEEEVISFL
jgi:hypothetical protein